MIGTREHCRRFDKSPLERRHRWQSKILRDLQLEKGRDGDANADSIRAESAVGRDDAFVIASSLMFDCELAMVGLSSVAVSSHSQSRKRAARVAKLRARTPRIPQYIRRSDRLYRQIEALDCIGTAFHNDKCPTASLFLFAEIVGNAGFRTSAANLYVRLSTLEY